MNYDYIIEKDNNLGLVIIELIDNKKNAQWKLSYLLEFKNSFLPSLDRFDKCLNWLEVNHPELLL
jgi:hypothetical protein